MTRIITQLALAACLFISTAAHAVTIPFSGPLTVIDIDEGGGLFSGVGLTEIFTGNIDNPGAFGSLSGAGITVNFTCCDAAGGLEIDNDIVIDDEVAGNLNLLTGSDDFMDGQVFDFVNLEGDSEVVDGGRIEIGLSYIFSPDTYAVSGGTLDPSNAILTAFFILEEDRTGEDIFAAVGLLDYSPQVIPVPAAAWLFASALGFLGWLRRRA